MTQHNRLAAEASLYLKQHANQPIHWWSWGPEALQEAHDTDRPIFLSVGYSSCHWCHVMARESFSDPEIAAFLNEHFVSIKVDREERPDIDQYYQQACQLFSKGGGWPLSAFLLPDTRPFFVGTYFAPKSDERSTGLLDLLKELLRAYREDRSKVEENAEQALQMLKEGSVSKEKVPFEGHFPSSMAVLSAVDQFYDAKNGGYGVAPKFPHFPFWEWALEQMLEGMIDKAFGEKIIFSLEKMLMGGLVDQVRGGIHRYATDEAWTTPHFEKMLYDQAGFLKVLSKLGLLYPSPLVFDTLLNTLDYLETEMLSDSHYFFSAQDAESEGVEGLYFTFTKEEFLDALLRHDDEAESLAKNQEQLLQWFNVSEEGNFSHQLNVLYLNYQEREKIFTKEGVDLLRKARLALFQERKLRVPPATDSKGVASWNFLLVQALVDVIQYSQIDVIRSRATQLFNKVLQGVFATFIARKDQGMQLAHTTTQSSGLPYAEDFVFFAEMQLRLYEVTGNQVFKTNLSESLQFILKEFVDHEQLLTRARLSTDYAAYPNLAMSPFDSSFRSPVASLIGLVRRARVLFQEPELGAEALALQEQLVHQVLKNPISGAEGLRALTYPDQAYRVVQIPLHWLKEERFVRFLPYFLPRFVLDYRGTPEQPSDETWQICGLTQCELKGLGLEEFIQTLAPKRPEGD